jgi:hypothetical protein
MTRSPNRGAVAAAAAAVALASGALVACGGSSSSSSSDTPAAAEPPPPAIKPASYANTATDRNRFFPLKPGYQSVRLGKVNRGSRRLAHRRVTTVTDVFKVIDGVRAVAILDQDFDGGQIAEQALDYLAVDRRGTVSYLGSYTEAYEGGQFVNANDGWLAGVKGAKPGIYMLAKPKVGAPAYTQEDHPGSEPTIAKVVRTGVRKCVSFKCYSGVLVIEEGGSENKYFAPGVGGIKTEPKGGGEQETEELINLTQLRRRGLAELSNEALKLDRHARTTVPDVFGSSRRAARKR